MSPFVRPRPMSQPALRMIAFHHAGGSASAYYPLIREMPADWDLVILDLPGRGKRHAEKPIRSMSQLVARVVEDVSPLLDAPIALFGHSLGAILAAEVGRALESLGAQPVWVGISGRVAPSFQAETRRRLHEMNDDELLRELFALGGMPRQLDEMPEFRERFLKIARADLAAVESYEPEPDRAPLSCPLTVFGGTSDPWVPSAAMHAWEYETRSNFQHRFFPGGHFYFLGGAFAGFAREVVANVKRAVGVLDGVVHGGFAPLLTASE